MWFFSLYVNHESKKISIEEFREIFLNIYPELCIYASRFVGNLDTAEDIVQDVLERFWLENEKLINKNHVKPYLYKAVKNRALNYNKRERRKSGLDEILNIKDLDFELSNDSDAISFISFRNLQTDLENAISELPEQRQLIFRMSRYQQMKHKEIAEELKISYKTVETQIYRSLVFLQEKLKHYLNDR